MNLLTVQLTGNSDLNDVTRLIKDTLSEIHARRNESHFVLLSCEHANSGATNFVPAKAVTAWEKALRQLEMSPATIIYVCDGDAFGPALDLLLIADFRILRKGAKVGFLRRNGLAGPEMSLYRLTNQIGQGHARRLYLGGKPITAEKACDLGLADEISDHGPGALDSALERFANIPSSELALRRRLLLEAHALEYENALGAYLAARSRGQAVASA